VQYEFFYKLYGRLVGVSTRITTKTIQNRICIHIVHWEWLHQAVAMPPSKGYIDGFIIFIFIFYSLFIILVTFSSHFDTYSWNDARKQESVAKDLIEGGQSSTKNGSSNGPVKQTGTSTGKLLNPDPVTKEPKGPRSKRRN